ncbi:hypothetical protein SAMN05421693_11548 [Ectothiorhodospira magna]|uniref:Flagellar Assembly Protein A N-terminal region domain-containing protein n=2 Tax=Ectothiorhodospira magna TaxID=867345 RepID=A0A1H9CZD2_9GAMM|nr:hypothetical protein SAMN05421693_11548 [Ectothiorhodospira magna]
MTDQTPQDSSPTWLALHVDEEDHRLIARVTALPEQGAASAAVMEHITNAGFGTWVISDSAIKDLVNAVAKADPSLDQRTFCLARRHDGKFNLTIDPKREQVVLNIEPPRGGQPVTEVMVRERMAAKSVVHGIDEDALTRAVLLGEQDPMEVVIARATPPAHGSDTVFESLIPKARRRMPHIDERGRADYRDLGEVPQVKPGTPLVRRHPATAGVPGVNVLGQAIPARSGREFPFSSKLRNVVPSADDPAVLESTLHGIPVLIPRGAMVEESLEVDKVDLSSGNLSFEGSVLIRGDVVSGMKVTASGDILVNGMVEGAILEAGGDIQIKRGVVGQLHQDETHEGKSRPTARLKAKGTVSSRFIENAWVEADHVLIHEQMVHCQISATHEVTVGGTGARKGQIVGGSIRAGEQIECHMLGSPTAPQTQVVVGADPKLRDQLAELEQRLDAQHHLAEELVRTLNFVQQHPERVAADFKTRATNTLAEVEGHVQELEQEKAQLLEQMARFQDATIVVQRRIYSGVEVCIGDKVRRIEAETLGGVFKLQEGEVILDHAPG